MIFVYGTKGNTEENQWAFIKARYDAERFWYQGNGSVDVIQDTEFDLLAEPDRNVILYGNAQTNQAWERITHQFACRGETRRECLGWYVLCGHV